MPLVNPMTTGRGMYFTAVPRPVMPRRIKITPAMSVHMNRPSRPCAATMPETTTTNAPVGPADLHSRAAEGRHREPGHDGAVDAVLRRQSGGDRERHRERESDQPDRHPAIRSRARVFSE